MTPDILITVFIPVYNGEKYLRETLTSIINQTYKNFEVLLVDDASTDNSLSILKEFEKRDSRFRVFSKKNGGMVAISWNFIMPNIQGDYVFYSSQDDIFSINLIEEMVKRQKQTNADTIIPDMEFFYQGETNNKKIIGLNEDRDIIIDGKKALIESLNWNIHGFALTRTSLLREEIFPEDAFDSDEFITRKLFLKSNKIAFSNGLFKYRQDNPNALTKSFSEKNFYTIITQNRLYNLLRINQIDKKYLVNSQCELLKKYLYLMLKSYTYLFNSVANKKNIKLFLLDFKNKNLTNKFYFENIIDVPIKHKFKLIGLIILLKIL